MKFAQAALALFLSLGVMPQAFACFTVYNPAGELVYSSQQSPIDMSYEIHERLPAAFPDGHMVFGVIMPCPEIDKRVSAELSSTLASVVAPAPRSSSVVMTPAQRERAQDALTK